MWTRFMDIHSGGSCKESPYEYIYIEAPKDEACVVFYNRFGHSPHRGEDYSVSEKETLMEATGYDRGCHYDEKEKKYIDEPNKKNFNLNSYCSLEAHCQRNDVLVIFEEEIENHERQGSVPKQGYIWVD